MIARTLGEDPAVLSRFEREADPIMPRQGFMKFLKCVLPVLLFSAMDPAHRAGVRRPLRISGPWMGLWVQPAR